MRTTPERITELAINEVAVFGSNEQGVHGAGAARAMRQFGARMGQGRGLAGQTYALPTRTFKRGKIVTLPLSDIEKEIIHFCHEAQNMPKLTFLITPIGCGLAGWSEDQIAPLFKKHQKSGNLVFPKSFLKYLWHARLVTIEQANHEPRV